MAKKRVCSDWPIQTIHSSSLVGPKATDLNWGCPHMCYLDLLQSHDISESNMADVYISDLEKKSK